MIPRSIVSSAKALALAVVALTALPAGSRAQTPGNWPPITAPTADMTALLGTVPASLSASASWTSQCLWMGQARAFTFFGALQKAGTTQAQRYADSGCTKPIGAAVPSTALALTSGGGCPSSSYCGSNGLNDGLPALFATFTLTDTSASTNNVIAANLLQGAK